MFRVAGTPGPDGPLGIVTFSGQTLTMDWREVEERWFLSFPSARADSLLIGAFQATGGFMELMLRHDGEYGLGELGPQEVFVVNEAWVVVAGPFLLGDLIDRRKLAAVLPATIRKEMGYDNWQLGPFGP